VRYVDRTLLFLNLLLLLIVSLTPFPTAVLGRFVTVERDSHLAAAIYGGLMIVMSISFTLLWRHVSRDSRLLGQHLDPVRARSESVLFSAGLIGYVLGVVVAFVSAPLSLLIYGLVGVFYVFPWLPEVPAADLHEPAPRI